MLRTQVASGAQHCWNLNRQPSPVWPQFGIVSNGMYGQPGYYTDVSRYAAWITRGQQVQWAWCVFGS